MLPTDLSNAALKTENQKQRLKIKDRNRRMSISLEREELEGGMIPKKTKKKTKPKEYEENNINCNKRKMKQHSSIKVGETSKSKVVKKSIKNYSVLPFPKTVINEKLLHPGLNNSNVKKVRGNISQMNMHSTSETSARRSLMDNKKSIHINVPESKTRNSNKSKKVFSSTPRYPKNKKMLGSNTKRPNEGIPSGKNIFTDEKPSEAQEMSSEKIKRDYRSENQESSSSNEDIFCDSDSSQPQNIEILTESSEVTGKHTFEKILDPVSIDFFMGEKWQVSPIHISNKNTYKFKNIISAEEIDVALRHNSFNFKEDIDILMHKNSRKHNMEGRANAQVIRNLYSIGYTILIFHPEKYFSRVHALNSTLQEYFGSTVRSNCYLTPPQTQGVAPNYQDAELFILQVEGSTFWKLHEPKMESDSLPLSSRGNIPNEELGEPTLEVQLKPGDVLYFPRGYVHQAETRDQFSLHLTLYIYQKSSWFDLLNQILPLTLKEAASNDIEFRKGLPIGYLKDAGIICKNTTSKKEMIVKIRNFIAKLNDYIDVDAAVDQMGLLYVQKALPPFLTKCEMNSSVHSEGRQRKINGAMQYQEIITVDTKVRWIRAFCYRILKEKMTHVDGTAEKRLIIYHSLENSKENGEEKPKQLVIKPIFFSSLCILTYAYPAYTKVGDLPIEDNEQKVLFVSKLWDRGLLMTDDILSMETKTKNASGAQNYCDKEKNEEILISNNSLSSDETKLACTTEMTKFIDDEDEMSFPKPVESIEPEQDELDKAETSVIFSESWTSESSDVDSTQTSDSTDSSSETEEL